ncbi:MAG: 3,4-dihydroxy 2-butanone 4-phosphate synthase / cyclohydrolase [Campylobacterota bacterium]|nr:3,4-dihydroxy 2-butanone 4-phosphate synthase / cyclohydrolase [Campylobacterota bacterium]
MSEQRVLEAIEEIKKGNMVIMLDDEDRENEGDLVYAGVFSTPQKVNFLATHAKGLICVAIEKDRAKQLNLNPMVSTNTSSYETAFTVSVDAKNATTGISAAERDMTIKLLCDPFASSEDLVRPGHIFPLIAKEGGVLNRIGHTEGSVDLCKLAGLTPAGVICEIMKDDGEMARRDDLDIFAKKHNLKMIYISDLIEYRMKRESLIKEISKKETTFFDSAVISIDFQDHLKRVHTAIIFKEISKISNVKFHNISKDIELLQNPEQYNGIIKSIEYLKNNSGLLIFMDNTLINDTAIKEFGIGAQILHHLGIHKINLLSTKKISEMSALNGFGLEIKEEIILK